MEETLRLILDMAILMSLGVTIFYAMRLTSSLSSFRRHKGEFERLMRDVSTSIDQAHDSVEKVKSTGRISGGELQKTIDESQYLLDELRLMNQAAESLAQRLEKGSQQKSASKTASDIIAEQSFEPVEDKMGTKASGVGTPSFFIKDKDYEDTLPSISKPSRKRKPDELSSPKANRTKSRAEQELLDALTKQQG